VVDIGALVVEGATATVIAAVTDRLATPTLDAVQALDASAGFEVALQTVRAGEREWIARYAAVVDARGVADGRGRVRVTARSRSTGTAGLLARVAEVSGRARRTDRAVTMLVGRALDARSREDSPNGRARVAARDVVLALEIPKLR